MINITRHTGGLVTFAGLQKKALHGWLKLTKRQIIWQNSIGFYNVSQRQLCIIFNFIIMGHIHRNLCYQIIRIRAEQLRQIDSTITAAPNQIQFLS